MKHCHTNIFPGVLFLLAYIPLTQAIVIDTDDLPLPPQSYWNGADLSGGFESHHVHFGNQYDTNWSTWTGFAYSNVNDTNTPDYLNQYASYSGLDISRTGNYVVVYDSSWQEDDIITFPLPSHVQGFYINNSTYAALTMRDGNFFSKKFGGPTGTDPDWFMLTITAKDPSGNPIASTNHFLADYRYENSGRDYIQSEWQWVDLRPFGANVKTLHFSLSSSDSGAWGMNTPAYFAMDSLSYSYAPAAGLSNSSAISMTNLAFAAWATGWTNYAVGSFCDSDWQTPAQALGPATGDAYDIVCLGEGGQITLTFNVPISDGPGYDFAVFENAVVDTFLELAWVEVSSDGINYIRFPNQSLTPGPVVSYGAVSSTNISGFAGKYIQGYGTPFDLQELKDQHPDLNVQNIRYVRLIDIPGGGSCTDSLGHAIYDPYPNSGSAGFDLDAIGIINFAVGCDDLQISSSGNIQFSFTTVTNRIYQIQCADSLTSTNWYDFGPAITGQNESVAIQGLVNKPTQFYRIVTKTGQ